MQTSSHLLLFSAATIAIIHTAIGPDHYLPFIVLGRAEGWTYRKTIAWTILCGAAHILSSIILGFAGVALGWTLSSMERLESLRGQIAGLALIGFGLIYFSWGLWRSKKGGHSHLHIHHDGSVHSHPHPHQQLVKLNHSQSKHEDPEHLAAHRRTLWVLFTIFVLGPCEPLIPLLMAPASRHDLWGVISVAGVFGVLTVAAMVTFVTIGRLGIQLIRLHTLERYAHALAGLAILVSGLLIQFLGL
jgi:4-amino-4-deoxy-L-arabinose transferase-like glycosyltransferase